MKTNKIFLLGFMGCGKSTLGKKLASKLRIDFIDLDQFIEKKENQTVQQLFKEYGESYFRELERDCLNEVAQLSDKMVIALGGGTPCYFNNMEVINQSGVSIYLKYNTGILASRLINAKIDRPLLKGKTKEEIIQFIKETSLKREKYYQSSNLVIEKDNVKVEELVALIQDIK